MLRLLAELGLGFDCASKMEMDQVIALGVEPSRIIYAHSCKARAHIRHAVKLGIKRMTFDNSDELFKIKELCPGAELYLRIATDDTSSLYPLSVKFGASLPEVQALLECVIGLNLNLVGVSFHVGSGATKSDPFVKAVEDARIVFSQAASLGLELRTLDVGGGFTSDCRFESTAAALSSALDNNFSSSVEIIAEPGRFFVADAYTLACSILARRRVLDLAPHISSYMLYLNDGIFSNFACQIWEQRDLAPDIIMAQNGQDSKSMAYKIWGQTCDGVDLIAEKCILRGPLDVGDWLSFGGMGAYTRSLASQFNGFSNNHQVLYVCSEAEASSILQRTNSPRS